MPSGVELLGVVELVLHRIDQLGCCRLGEPAQDLIGISTSRAAQMEPATKDENGFQLPWRYGIIRVVHR